MTIPAYVPGAHITPYTTITPFTYRDNYTYLLKLEELSRYIRSYLVPTVTELTGEVVEGVNNALDNLDAAIELAESEADRAQTIVDGLSDVEQSVLNLQEEINLAVSAGKSDLDAKITNAETDFSNTISLFNNDVNSTLSTIEGIRDEILDAEQSVNETQTEINTIVDGLGDDITNIVRAEFGDELTAPWAFSGERETVLTVPTHEGSGQSTHPSLLYIPEGFGGFKYWLAHTPYPNANENHEDPNISASHDGTIWVTPTGLVNPLDDQPGAPGAHNSDTNLVIGPDGLMYVLWRMVDRPDGNRNRLFWRTSTDGVTWTTKREIISLTGQLLSPSLVWTGSRWELYGFEGGKLVRYDTTNANPSTGTTWNKSACTTSMPTGFVKLWHGEVKKRSGIYFALLNYHDSRGQAEGGELFIATSDDGLHFNVAQIPALPDKSANMSRYQGSLEYISGSGLDTVFEIIYGRIIWSGANSTWRLVRSRVTAPDTIGALTIRAGGRQPIGGYTAKDGAYAVNMPLDINPGNIEGALAVSFPVGLFSEPPLVFLTKQQHAFNNWRPYVYNITNSGCMVGIRNVHDAPMGGVTAQRFNVAVYARKSG